MSKNRHKTVFSEAARGDLLGTSKQGNLSWVGTRISKHERRKKEKRCQYRGE